MKTPIFVPNNPKMNMLRFLSIALLGSVSLYSCKYDEGPGISLRAKRDRVANEWKVVKMTYGGVDVTNKINDTIFSSIINLSRTGKYNIVHIDKFGKTSHTGKWGEKWVKQYNGYCDHLPYPIKDLAMNGEWTFDYRHDKIQLFPELSTGADSFNVRGSFDWGIIMLKEKQMKVIGKDRASVDWNMELAPVNGEPYWY